MLGKALSICSRCQKTKYLRLRNFSGLSEARSKWGNRLVISDEVEHALQSELPVIALESTIITHGMPHPTNLQTAQSVESIIRSRDVTPATIALFDGRIHIGLSQSQLERLSDTSISGKIKVSRRDLAPVLSQKLIGGTTVASTMYIAASVGIGMFVTGGIGGVHRGAENSMDISADLIELGRTPVAVVCAGAKSILDIPRTLEVLETQGVCVATFGDKPDFPAFYTPSSGHRSPWQVRTAEEASSLIHTSLTLPTPLSTLLAVPIPSEYSSEGDKVQQAVEQAVKESIEQGIDRRGKEVTPWLLKRVGELTDGSALSLNVKLIENNAAVGAEVATEVYRLKRDLQYASSSTPSSLMPASTAPSLHTTTTSNIRTSSRKVNLPEPSVLVFGAAAIDITSQSSSPLSPRSTTPGTIRLTPGGVGRNIAEAAQNCLGLGAVQLISAIGEDEQVADPVGKLLDLEMNQVGLRTDGLISRDNARTAACTLMLEKDGDLVNGVADMGIVESITADEVKRKIEEFPPKMVVFDCNLTIEAISSILTTSNTHSIPTFCDPTSIPKLPRLISALIPLIPPSPASPRPLTHLSPNTLELSLIHELLSDVSQNAADTCWEFINSLNLTSDWRSKIEGLSRKSGLQWLTAEGVIQKSIALLPWVENLWIKSGKRGVIHVAITPQHSPGSSNGVTSISQELQGVHSGKFLVVSHYESLEIPDEEVISTTGAGDSLVGGIVAGLVEGKASNEIVRKALEGVGRSLRSHRAVA